MLVLVTGATGFIGSHAVAALRRDGHDVRILVRHPDRVAPALEPHGVTASVVIGDMTDPRSVATAVSGCDAVIHAAGEVGLDPVVYTSTVTYRVSKWEAELLVRRWQSKGAPATS